MTIPSDHELDARLRDIAVPVDLAARLKVITTPSDDELDELLCGLAMPEALSLALHAIPEDELIEQELQEVETPLTLRGDVQLPTPASRWRAVENWLLRGALAVVLFVALSATFFSTTAAYLASVYPPATEPQWVLLPVSPADWEAELVDSPLEIDVPALEPEMQIVASPPEMQVPRDADVLLANWDETLGPAGPRGAVSELQALLRGGIRPWDDVVLLRWGLLGAPHYAEDELPELTRVLPPQRTGIELPPVPGYDRRFMLREGVFPPVLLAPQTDAKLTQLAIPLSTSVESFDAAERALALGKLPSPDEIRAEQFIATLDARYPAAPIGRLQLNVQGGPSPFGPADALLLQVGAQAGKLRREGKRATHLIIAVDTSASMARGRRLEIVRQAIERAHRQLGPRDALSLVAFDEEVVCRVEHLNATQGDELHEELQDLLPRSGTNLAAGVQTAASVALTEPATLAGTNYRRRLVLITDSRAALPDNTAEKISEVLALIRSAGVGLDVLDISGRSEADPLLKHWTELLGGSYRAVTQRRQLYAALVESLAGQNPAVASEGQLRLTLNKEAVAAYRLIGHEQNLLAQVVPVGGDGQLLPEECSGALLELWLKPGASASVPLGEAKLVWKDPRTGANLEQKLKIDRKEFAHSFTEMPASLQTAAVAAEVAEQLRGSREALRLAGLFTNLQPRNNANTIRTVIRPWSTIRHEPDLQRLLALLDQLEKVRGK